MYLFRANSRSGIGKRHLIKDKPLFSYMYDETLLSGECSDACAVTGLKLFFYFAGCIARCRIAVF